MASEETKAETEPQLPPRADAYDGHYYGVLTPPTGNYRGYEPNATPHWVKPLARWLTEYCWAPFLDVGCAYGHLVHELEQLGRAAWGVEWSEYAYRRRVAENVMLADGRRLLELWPFGGFQTIVSLDYLEHFPPDETVRALAAMDAVLEPGGRMVHLVGAHNPTEDLSRHQSDPTHLNHEPLEWYRERIVECGNGYNSEWPLEEHLNRQPAWKDTDWNGRMIVYRKAGAVENAKAAEAGGRSG